MKRGQTPRSHGLAYTPEYRAWQTMRHRCTQPTSPVWDSYGGRGITICDEWLNDPAAFIAHIGPRPSRHHELDRIDNDRGYDPGNVRWTSRSVNDRNRRSSRLVTHVGETLTIAAWSERTGIRRDTLKRRLDAGWTPALALSTPTRAKRTNLAHPARVRRSA